MARRTFPLALACALAWLALAGCSGNASRPVAEAGAADSIVAPPAPPAPPPPPPAPAAAMADAAAPAAARAYEARARAEASARKAAGERAALDAVSVSGSRMRESREVRAPRPPKPAPTPTPAPQSGLLTAGDYDDLLNPAMYARYAERYLQQHGASGLPFVDTRKALRVRVHDGSGNPVPFAQVRIGGSTLPTAANGEAVFFPSLDDLATPLQVDVSAPAPSAARRSLRPASLPADGLLHVELPTRASGVKAMDLLLVLDTTGSMGDELAYLQSELDAILDGLRRKHANLDLRLGLVVYRDQGDEYVVRRFEFTGNTDQVRAALAEQRASGGGDYPEAVDQAFAEASRFDWRGDAVKALLFVADAPPHDDKTVATWKQAEALRNRGVHIVPVAASGVADAAQYLMRSMAAATQGRYLFLTDDSGVGLPHQDPDVPCYVVTRLDQLIGRVLDGLVAGKRIEPAASEVIRTVGDYDRGVCLPAPRGGGGQPKIAY